MTRDNVIQIRVNDEDLKKIRGAADATERTVSDWGRRALLAMASGRGRVSGLMEAEMVVDGARAEPVFGMRPGDRVEGGGHLQPAAGDPEKAIGVVVSAANKRGSLEVDSVGKMSEGEVALPTEDEAYRRRFEVEFGVEAYKRMVRMPKLMKLPWAKRFEVAREQKERESGG